MKVIDHHFSLRPFFLNAEAFCWRLCCVVCRRIGFRWNAFTLWAQKTSWRVCVILLGAPKKHGRLLDVALRKTTAEISGEMCSTAQQKKTLEWDLEPWALDSFLQVLVAESFLKLQIFAGEMIFMAFCGCFGTWRWSLSLHLGAFLAQATPD